MALCPADTANTAARPGDSPTATPSMTSRLRDLSQPNRQVEAEPGETSLKPRPATPLASPASGASLPLSARTQRLMGRRLATFDRRLLEADEPADQVLVALNSIRGMLRHVPASTAAQVAADLVESAHAAYRHLLSARFASTPDARTA